MKSRTVGCGAGRKGSPVDGNCGKRDIASMSAIKAGSQYSTQIVKLSSTTSITIVAKHIFVLDHA